MFVVAVAVVYWVHFRSASEHSLEYLWVSILDLEGVKGCNLVGWYSVSKVTIVYVCAWEMSEGYFFVWKLSYKSCLILLIQGASMIL